LVYRDAEAVGNFTVFNIKGNKYRLIVSIDYEATVSNMNAKRAARRSIVKQLKYYDPSDRYRHQRY
jgi:hypothetical protein